MNSHFIHHVGVRGEAVDSLLIYWRKIHTFQRTLGLGQSRATRKVWKELPTTQTLSTMERFFSSISTCNHLEQIHLLSSFYFWGYVYIYIYIERNEQSISFSTAAISHLSQGDVFSKLKFHEIFLSVDNLYCSVGIHFADVSCVEPANSSFFAEHFLSKFLFRPATTTSSSLSSSWTD